jgi:hypothetical protein
MDLEEYNKLLLIAGGFVGLADDDDAIREFRYFDPDDESALKEKITKYAAPFYLRANSDQREEGMTVLARLAAQPRHIQKNEWEGDLSPFAYPKHLNLYKIIYDMLSVL